jgi:SAM-dependent methyltransferase
VLGVEPDERMAEYARRGGVTVEVSTIEAWDPAGRTFDAVVAGQTWHWVDPVAGAAKAAAVLRPGGLLALFWNAGEMPPEIGAAFGDVFERVLPDSLAARAFRQDKSAVDMYALMLAKAAEGIRETGAFGAPEEWRFDWEHTYTRDEYLDQVPTHGLNTQLPADTMRALLAGLGAAIDAIGGSFTMRFSTLASTAERTAPA